MSYEPPLRVSTTWEGYASYLKEQATNAPAPWRDHFAAEWAVVQPTLRALGIDADKPPPVRAAVVVPPSVTDAPPVTDPAATPGAGNRPPPTRNGGGAASNADISVFSTDPQVGQLTEDQGLGLGTQVARQLMKDFGFTAEQAAGIVGNLFHESAGMNANVNEFGWRYPEGDPRNYGAPFDNLYGYGWAQWTAERKTAYLNFCGENHIDPASPGANYRFLVHELKTTESQTVPLVLAAKSPEEAAVIFRAKFERAAMPVDGKRTAAADLIYNELV